MPTFVPRVRKQKARKRIEASKALGSVSSVQDGSEHIIGSSKAEVDESKRLQLRTALIDPTKKISSKKAKRLEKYIVSISIICLSMI
jgi:hypothetical protein